MDVRSDQIKSDTGRLSAPEEKNRKRQEESREKKG